jgi:aminocarboxymuconate-semialdehyde decarboxylase
VAVNNQVNPRHYLGKIYFDSLVHDAATLRFLIETVGVEKVALGSDYPFPLGETVPGTLIKSGNFSTAQAEWLLHRSALEWLGLKKEMFV